MPNEFDLLEFIKALSEQTTQGNTEMHLRMKDANKVGIYTKDESEVYSFSFPEDSLAMISKLEEIRKDLEIEFPLYGFKSSTPYNIKITIPQAEEDKCSYNIESVVNMKLLGFFASKNYGRMPAFDIIIT